MCSPRARPSALSVRSTFERDEAELGRLLDQYERNLISDDRDRRLLNDYRNRYREWLDRVKQVMSLSAAGRREEASEVLRGAATPGPGRAAEQRLRRVDSAQRGPRALREPDGRRLHHRRAMADPGRERRGHPADRPARVSHLSADREADSGPRRICQSDCRGGLRQGGPIHARDRRNRRPGALGRRPQAGRRGDGRTALGEGERVARDGSAAGRRLAGGVRPAPPVGPRADARRRRCRILRARREPVRAAARRDLRHGGCFRHPDGHPARRGPRGSMRAGTANARAGESPARLPAHFLRSRPGGARAGDGHAGDIHRYAARRPRSGILQAAHREGAGPARRIAARRRHEPGGPAAQPSDRGAARADPGAGASTRDPGGGARRRQAQGRRSHRDEVDVPREHEPRDPHADERHHRPVASGAQDVALPEAARLREQGPQRRHVAARRDQRHPRLFEDRGRPARYRDHGLQAGRRDQLGHDADGAEGPRQGPRVPGARRAGDPGTSARRSAASRADPDQPGQQRREVHRARRDSAQHRARSSGPARRCNSSAPCATPGSA